MSLFNNFKKIDSQLFSLVKDTVILLTENSSTNSIGAIRKQHFFIPDKSLEIV